MKRRALVSLALLVSAVLPACSSDKKTTIVLAPPNAAVRNFDGTRTRTRNGQSKTFRFKRSAQAVDIKKTSDGYSYNVNSTVTQNGKKNVRVDHYVRTATKVELTRSDLLQPSPSYGWDYSPPWIELMFPIKIGQSWKLNTSSVINYPQNVPDSVSYGSRKTTSVGTATITSIDVKANTFVVSSKITNKWTDFNANHKVVSQGRSVATGTEIVSSSGTIKTTATVVFTGDIDPFGMGDETVVSTLTLAH